MFRIDLSALSRTELKRLLAAAEARGQAERIEQLRAELAARDSGEAPRPPPAPAPDAFDDDEPLPMVVPDELPALHLELPRAPVAQRARPARGWSRGAAAAAVVLVVGGGAAVWALNGTPGLPTGDAAPAASPPASTAAPAPAPRVMVARVEAAVPVPPEAIAPPAPPAPSQPDPQPTPPPPEPRPAATLAKAESPAAPRRLDPCARPPTPADRLLCNDLGLNLLNHEMREAYGRAMDAGADPIAIRESQAAWRRARDPVSDPRALAQLYDRRIGELKAMAGGAPRPDAAVTTPERQQD